MRRYNAYDPPKTGEYVRMSRSLVTRFVYLGWAEDEVSTDSTWRVTGTSRHETLGTLLLLVAEPCLASRLRGVEFKIDAAWWDALFEARLTLAEKERVRMQNEPWVARRDENLSSMFKPQTRVKASALSGRRGKDIPDGV
jgi:hypothetical protein